MIQENIGFESLLAPGIVIINNITYVIPGWYKISNDTTLSEVLKHWKIPEQYSIKTYDNLNINEKVISKRTGETYSVKFDGKYWSCTCQGFSFRRSCKHIEEIKLKHKM
jgi:hypothetical protein